MAHRATASRPSADRVCAYTPQKIPLPMPRVAMRGANPEKNNVEAPSVANTRRATALMLTSVAAAGPEANFEGST